MRKLTGFVLGVLLLSSAPVLASGLVPGEPRMPTWRATESSADAKYGCSLDLYLQTHKSPHQFVRGQATFDSPNADDRWASGATYQWNVGLNRAVDHLFEPPANVNVYATQTGEDLRGHYESTNSPNTTLAAFEVVIH